VNAPVAVAAPVRAADSALAVLAIFAEGWAFPSEDVTFGGWSFDVAGAGLGDPPVALGFPGMQGNDVKLDNGRGHKRTKIG
jgi:hypothetical protein